MSDDMGWREFRESTRKKRRDQLDEAIHDADDGGWTKHTNWHWSRTVAGSRLDFWPSTRRWRWRGRTYYGTCTDAMNFIKNKEQS